MKKYSEKRHPAVDGTDELTRLLDQLRTGDVLIVSRLDRLSRSLRDLLMIMERIQEAKAGFRSLTEAIDTTTAPGRMMMQMVGAFAVDRHRRSGQQKRDQDCSEVEHKLLRSSFAISRGKVNLSKKSMGEVD